MNANEKVPLNSRKIAAMKPGKVILAILGEIGNLVLPVVMRERKHSFIGIPVLVRLF